MRNRILFLGDSYRGDQEPNIRRLYDLLAPVVKSCGGFPELCVSACNRQSGSENWMSGWVRSLNGMTPSVLQARDLDRAAVVAFELSFLDKKYLDSVGVPWVNFEIHPVRFLDDLYFNVESSFVADFSALELPEDYIQVRADVLRARYGFAEGESSRRILIVGQTPIDKSIYFDGVFKKISDYFDSLDNVVRSFSGVDYRPHPYLTDAEVDQAIRSRYSTGECADWDFYRILASGRYGAVCGISSSALHESPYFGLESIALEKRARAFGRPVSYGALLRDCHLWLSSLFDTAVASRKYDVLPPVPENYLRQVYCSWAYVTKEDEAKELLSELKRQVAAVQDNPSRSEALVMQAKLEERLAAAEARTFQTDGLLTRAENRVSELNVLLEEARSELVQAQTVARLQQAHFEERLASAGARAAQAEQSLVEAEARAAEFAISLQAVKSELDGAKTIAQLQQAHFEERLASAGARAAQAEQSLVEAEARAAEFAISMQAVKSEQQSRLADLERQLATALTDNHYHWQLASERAEELARVSGLYDQVNQALQASEAARSSLAAERDQKSGEIQYWHQRVLDLHASTSWKLTKPLRGLKRLINGEAEAPQSSVPLVARGLCDRSQLLLEHGIRYVVRRPGLKTVLRKAVALLPGIERRLVEIRTAQVRSDLSRQSKAIASVSASPGDEYASGYLKGFVLGGKRSVNEILDCIRAELRQQAGG